MLIPYKDKNEIVDSFNHHFVTAGHLFKSITNQPIWAHSPQILEILTLSLLSHLLGKCSCQNCNICRKSAGPEGLDPSFLMLVADIIDKPLTHIFN